MYKYFTFLLISVLLIGCSSEEDANKSPEQIKKERAERTLPKSNGSHAEMLVMIKDRDFQAKSGEAMMKVFAKEQDGLPQPEALFKILKVEPAKANTLLKRNKTILVFEQSDTASITIHKNVWARPQIVATIKAPTDKERAELLEEHSEDLVSRFQDHDRMIMKRVLYRSRIRKLPPALSELGISEMIITEGFKQTLDRDNLKIFKNKALRTDQYLIFYIEPMREGVVSGEEIIASRDSIGKNYIEGFRDSSYMATEMLIPPVQKIVDIGDMFAVESRGLWKTVGDFMGGPFISYTIYDEVNDQMITIEGMIYGPDSKKRNVLFELETMIRSVRMN